MEGVPVERRAPSTSARVAAIAAGIRARPEMYLGAVKREWAALLMEGALCIGLESLAVGRARRVELRVVGDREIRICQDGQFPEFLRADSRGMSLAEAVMTELRACQAQKPTDLRGLCRVPIVVPNALSERAFVRVRADTAAVRLDFARGWPQGSSDEVSAQHAVEFGFRFNVKYLSRAICDSDLEAVRASVLRAVPCGTFDILDAR